MPQTASTPIWRRSRVRMVLVSVAALVPLAVVSYNLAALIGDAADLSNSATDNVATGVVAGTFFGAVIALSVARSVRQVVWTLVGFLAILLTPTVILYALGYRPDIM
ncbi:MAG: hypothetical protein IRZ05_00135 [Micromonosporaceae bacterium]|nr:hypothetical protein [Micromonosporaceae bacterium]